MSASRRRLSASRRRFSAFSWRDSQPSSSESLVGIVLPDLHRPEGTGEYNACRCDSGVRLGPFGDAESVYLCGRCRCHGNRNCGGDRLVETLGDRLVETLGDRLVETLARSLLKASYSKYCHLSFGCASLAIRPQLIDNYI